MSQLISRRKLLARALSGAAALSLVAACGQQNPTTPAAEATTAPTTGAAAAATSAPTTAAAAATSAPTTAAVAATTAPTTVSQVNSSAMEIEYWHRLGGDGAAMLETLANEFSQQNNGAIKVTAIAQGNIQELNQKVRAAAAGGGLPGAMMGDDYDVTQYAAADIIVPLDALIADSANGFTPEQIADILPNQLTRHKLPIYNDQTMAFTQGFSAFTTFWNIDALEKAGVEAPPKSWDEFPDHLRTVVKANPGMSGWLIGGAGDRFISTLLTYGVEWLKPSSEESNFDAPETLEIMTWWRQLADEGLLAVPSEGARDAFINGQSVYFMDSSGNTAGFSKDLTAFRWSAAFPLQRTTGGTPVTETYGPVNMLPKTDADKQLAGWMWMKWLLTPEVHSRYAAATNYFPATKSAIADPGLKAYYEGNPTARRLVDEVAPYARILAPSAALSQVRGQITANVVNEVLLKQLSPEDGVLKLKAEADDAIRQAMQG